METKASGNSFVEEISAMPGGEQIRLCIQCGTCSASCPNAAKMEHTPRQIIAMARAGMRDEVLTSNSMWYCASCFLCTVRCPRDIRPTELMHALEYLSLRRGVSTKKTSTPMMYKSFSEFVSSLGSVSEVGFMVRYFILSRVNPLRVMKMTPLMITLITHGRLNIKARKLKPEAEKQFKAILDKAEELGG